MVFLLASASAAPAWREPAHRAALQNDTIEAIVQAGLLCGLKDRATGQELVRIDPGKLPSRLPIFGPDTVDLDRCTVAEEKKPDSITTRWKGEDGSEIELCWSIEPKNGDLVLRMSARAPKGASEIRAPIFGCELGAHRLVWVDGYGVGRVIYPGSGDVAAGDPMTGASPSSLLHPLVALFENMKAGGNAGWFIEGREERIGPSCLMIRGLGEGHAGRAWLAFVRKFVEPTTEPKLFEVRIRTYKDNWADAVDPYVNWMEKDVGYVPFEKKNPEWVRHIRTQAYIRIGDFEGLENLVKRLDPKQTLIGRMVGAWIHPMDIGYPDYTMTETAKPWIKRARELGFHVGVHFNTCGISKDRPDLIERFRNALQVTGKDAQGNDTYQAVDGPHRHYYVSTASKDWRQYFIEQIRPAIEAGVDLVYLDESMAAMGKFVVDGMTAIQGVMAEERLILDTYPHVAIETEQFNPMNSRWSSFALSQMPLGHPLGGYIFRRFVKVVPEGVMGEPTGGPLWDAFASWGFMLPGGAKEESWLQISKAYQDYELVPDARMPREFIPWYEKHYTLGSTPRPDEGGDAKFFGLRGRDGITAYYQRQGNRRGLVLYEPGKAPRWTGVRMTGVATWKGPGVLRDFVPETGTYTDWLLYDGDTQLGLDPTKSYLLDEAGKLDNERFHLTRAPADFMPYRHEDRRIRGMDSGRPEGLWYRIIFTGHGEVRMHVPDGYRVFFDGREVKVDGQTATVKAAAAEGGDKPSMLIAFRKTDVPLVGPWVNLPWAQPPNQRSFYLARQELNDYSADGPVRIMKPGMGFYNHMGGEAVIVGRFPKAKKISLQGAYGMREESMYGPGDGVVRINGKEVLRVPGGPRPFRVYEFNADVTEFAGQFVLMTFGCEGEVHAAAMADWFNPQVLVEDGKVTK